YALAWLLPMIIIVVRLGRNFGLYEQSDFVDMATFGALTLQAVLLFIGGADRLAKLQREHRGALAERAILSGLSEVVFQMSAAGRWTFLNQAWEDFTGTPIAKAIGHSFRTYVDPADYQQCLDAFASLQSGMIGEYSGEVRFPLDDGTVRWVAFNCHLRYAVDGSILGTGGSFHDITLRRAAQNAVATSEDRYRALSENSIAGIIHCDVDWQVTYSNPAFTRITGLSPQQALGPGWLEAVGPERRAAMRRDAEDPNRLRTGAVAAQTLRYVLPDGSVRWGMTGLSATYDRAGRVTGYAGVTLDVTEQTLATEALLASEERFAALAKLSPAVIFRADADGNCSFVNGSWYKLTGRKPRTALGIGWTSAIHPGDRSRMRHDWEAISSQGVTANMEYRFCHRDGDVRWTTVATAKEFDADDRLVGYVGVITDITPQKLLELELQVARDAAELAATIDELTGLSNRRHFMDALGHEVARSRRYGQPLALAMLDVDFFKLINDSYGHPHGDGMLRAVAAVLAEAVRETDLVGRVGGEEFAVMMPATNPEMALVISERIRLAIAAVRLDLPTGGSTRVTISAGVAGLAPGETMHDLISRTDQALYKSKNGGRNQVRAAA
ncbi:MAG: sensor domain-containing diguanylate cyclase, partial [Janthinobacterium lividum]